jgi:hypothetical protein
MTAFSINLKVLSQRQTMCDQFSGRFSFTPLYRSHNDFHIESNLGTDRIRLETFDSSIPKMSNFRFSFTPLHGSHNDFHIESNLGTDRIRLETFDSSIPKMSNFRFSFTPLYGSHNDFHIEGGSEEISQNLKGFTAISTPSVWWLSKS